MRKRILIAVVVLAVLAAAGDLAGTGPRRPSPSDRIAISGNIEMTQVQIGFKTAGKLIERTVDEGDRVKKGHGGGAARPGAAAAPASRRRRPRSASAKAQLAQAETA